MSASIHPDTSLTGVELTVRDLAAESAFYRERLGLEPLRSDAGRASFGAGGRMLLELVEQRDARRVRGVTGLYHFALLLPSRRELANALARLATTGTALTGVADHGVSEALYLDDPEGNGIELYRDRPRAEWPLVNGELTMATDPLDLGELIAGADADRPIDMPIAPGTTLGHMHLHVAQLESARAFYADTLGFDLMQRLGSSALFLSAGGYHHHVGLNTWLGVGAPPPPPDALGLRRFTVRLPSDAAARQVHERLERAQIAVQSEREGFSALDPSQNRVGFEVASG